MRDARGISTLDALATTLALGFCSWAFACCACRAIVSNFSAPAASVYEDRFRCARVRSTLSVLYLSAFPLGEAVADIVHASGIRATLL